MFRRLNPSGVGKVEECLDGFNLILHSKLDQKCCCLAVKCVYVDFFPLISLTNISSTYIAKAPVYKI